MKRIEQMFTGKRSEILNVYCTAGFPQPDSTRKVMAALQASAADMIELGIPYSDPIADGPVIQDSNAVALANGMSISTLFNQLEGFRKDIHLPVILMGYLNPVLQFGFEKFCEEASRLGVDALILPDMPVYEFQSRYQQILDKYQLGFIFLVTPETTAARVRLLDSLSTGFLYAVSSSSTTGQDKNLGDTETYLQRLNSYGLKNPVLVGFGIKDRQSFQAVCKNADGAVIGSAYINTLKSSDDIESSTRRFIGALRGKDQR